MTDTATITAQASSAMEQMRGVLDSMETRVKTFVLLRALGEAHAAARSRKGYTSKLWQEPISDGNRLDLAAAFLIDGKTAKDAIRLASLPKDSGVNVSAFHRWINDVKQIYFRRLDDERIRRIEAFGDGMVQTNTEDLADMLVKSLGAHIQVALSGSCDGEVGVQELYPITRAVEVVTGYLKIKSDAEHKSAQAKMVHQKIKDLLERGKGAGDGIPDSVRSKLLEMLGLAYAGDGSVAEQEAA